jgi:hypothetical protein
MRRWPFALIGAAARQFYFIGPEPPCALFGSVQPAWRALQVDWRIVLVRSGSSDI